ncbi:hypothetical protein XENORESO_001991 [Xenotaenia resolanae]|uniref:Uncharacterized protein n=1 Tax=Xenotaenia resolanae TaxID=208358 RepID=A0ABV0X179_9TELE
MPVYSNRDPRTTNPLFRLCCSVHFSRPFFSLFCFGHFTKLNLIIIMATLSFIFHSSSISLNNLPCIIYPAHLYLSPLVTLLTCSSQELPGPRSPTHLISLFRNILFNFSSGCLRAFLHVGQGFKQYDRVAPFA